MAAQKNLLKISIIVVVMSIVLAGVFFAGIKIASSSSPVIDEMLAELRTEIDKVAAQTADIKVDIKADIQQNTESISRNTKAIEANKRTAVDSVTKVKTLNNAVSREISNLKSSTSSSNRQQLSYLEKTLGLKWFKRSTDGHLYCLTPYPLPWHHAQDFASKVGGSLVVIDDEEENKWLNEAFGSGTEYWIGLSDEHEEGKWKWVNGKNPSYTNWSTGEPDNYRKAQHHVIINKQAARGTNQPGKWNDITGNEIKIGIIELAK